jgi:hypothetical protein
MCRVVCLSLIQKRYPCSNELYRLTHAYYLFSIFPHTQTILAVVAALVASASAFAPAKTAFTSSALFNPRTKQNKPHEQRNILTYTNSELGNGQ